MTDPPKKVAAVIQQAEDAGLEWTEIPGFFRADRRFQFGRRDAYVWIHWFPGKTERSVGTIKATYYDGVAPQRLPLVRAIEKIIPTKET